MSTYTQEQRWDRQRDLRKHEENARFQKRAVERLVGYLHGLMLAGHFANSPEIERALHARVCEVYTEFSMDKPPAPRVRA